MNADDGSDGDFKVPKPTFQIEQRASKKQKRVLSLCFHASAMMILIDSCIDYAPRRMCSVKAVLNRTRMLAFSDPA